MERLLTSCSAPAVVLLFLLITRASSAAVSSRSLLFNHMNDVNNNNHERTLSQEKSGSDSPASSSWRDAASRPPSSLANHRTAGRARLFNVTELLCPKCILQPLLTGGSPSLPVPSAGGASPSSTSSTKPNPLSLLDQNQLLTEEEMKELQLERFKAQILAKMHLTEKPQVTIKKEELHSFISSGIVPGMLAGFSDPKESPTTPTPNTVILSTKSEPCHRRHSQKSTCFVITLEGSLSEGVSRAVLWFWRIKDGSSDDSHPLVLRQISRHPRHSQSQGTIIAQNAMSTSKTSGWITVDLSEAVKSWVSDGLTEVPVDISCPTCGGRKSHVSLVPDQKPFVIITMQPPKIRQQRSTVECSSSTVGGCCRASMNVTIAQMGWEDWIFQPTSFDFYYCRGHCNPSTSGHSSDTSNYIDMLNRLIRQQPRGSARQAALMPCCSPTSYVPIDIMYIKNSTLHIERINDLIVESCGCIG